MSNPGLASPVLSAIEAILPEVRALYVAAGADHVMSFEVIVGELKELEMLAEKRVSASEYASHRAALEACHVTSLMPIQRG